MKEHRYIAALAIVLLGFCVVGIAQAQAATRVTPCSPTTANNELCMTWSAVTMRTDGLPTIFPVTYRLEQQIGAGAFTTVSTGAATQAYLKNLAPGDYTYRVYAIENLVVSSPSATASKPIVQAPPNAPVIIIAATIRANGPPTYRVIQSVTLKANEVVFVAPAAMRTLFVSR